MNKTIRKIVALGMGATMLAGTAAMALATDLSAYPSPFVKDGVFVGKIVIGEKAASVDVVGAMDIAASLQRASSVAVSGNGASSSASTADGYKFQENKILLLGGTLQSVGVTVVDSSNLPVLLAGGTVEADSGTNYDYTTEVQLGASTGVVSANVNTDSDIADLYQNKAPVVFFDLNGAIAYKAVVDFQDTINLSSLKNSETIDLFGQTYTFASDNTGNTLTLYGSENTILVAKGGKETVKYNGKDYTIEVLGGNSDGSSAIVRINGDTRTLVKGDSKTLGGLPVYAKNVFISNIGGDDVSIQLFVGSNKLELNRVTGDVKLNDVTLNEVNVAITSGSNWGDVNTIAFTVTPSDGRGDREVKHILPGTSYTDPLFGSFKLEFIGATDLAAGKDALTFDKSSRKLNVEFQAQNAPTPTKLTLYENNAVQEDIWTGNTLKDLTRDKIFIWNGGTATEQKTHILQIKSISLGNTTSDTDFEVDVEDLTYGKTYTVTKDSKALDSDISLYAVNGTDKNKISFSASINGVAKTYTDLALYTENGAKVVIQSNATGSWAAANGTSLSGTGSSGTPVNNRFFITEDYKADKKDSSPTSILVTESWDSGDSAYHLATNATTGIGNDDNNDYGLTSWGTYIVADTTTGSSGTAFVKLYVPSMEVGYDAFLLPVASEVTVTSAATGGAVALNPISVGMAILDSEATLGSKPYIVVGGPCANTVAMTLMGTDLTNCAAGFTEGKAMIKLFSDKNALLVAGNSGKDTQGASRVLANYNNPAYALSGSEVEVITANLQSLTVKKVSS